jgi:hypothetical protein
MWHSRGASNEKNMTSKECSTSNQNVDKSAKNTAEKCLIFSSSNDETDLLNSSMIDRTGI